MADQEAQQPQQPEGPGVLRRVINAIINPEQLEQAQRQAQYEEAQRQILENQAANARLRAEVNARAEALENGAYFHLREMMIGKKLDGTWQSYATGVLRDYLDQSQMFVPEQRVRIIEGAIRRYTEHLHIEQGLRITDILAMKRHNQNLKGEVDNTVWWNPLTWHNKLSLAENTNGSSPEQNLYSGTQLTTIALGAAGLALAGAYCISRLSWTPIVGSIIPRTYPQLSPPTAIATNHPSLAITIPGLEEGLTNILKSLSDTRESTPANNTSTELLITLSERFIKGCVTTLKKAADMIVEYSHSSN
uniref:Uncharacterized protein n=1 Tax=Cushing virus TaxID=2600346 RepID=A0A5B8XDJ9_9TOMB|nr:hypothetical protein 2 [Cushing virus]